MKTAERSIMKKAATILFQAAIFLLIPFFLSACFYSEEDVNNAYATAYEKGLKEGYEDGYEEGHNDGYAQGYADGEKEGYKKGYSALKPVVKPSTGTILEGQEYLWQSKITVNAPSTQSCVVALKTSTGTTRLAFFVRAGESATIGVPKETLYVYFACGETWYGYRKGFMFGEETSYSKDGEPVNFASYTITYTLNPVYGGNFSDVPVSEGAFF